MSRTSVIRERICKDCGVVSKDFEPYKKSCRPCRREAQRALRKAKYTADPEYYKELARKYEIRYNAWRDRSREAIRLRALQYRRTPKGSFVSARQVAKKRGHEWTVPEEMYVKFMEDNRCDYCGGPLGVGGTKLDRLDNSKGYLVDNVVPCCMKCNSMRGAHMTPYEARVLAGVLNDLRSSYADSAV